MRKNSLSGLTYILIYLSLTLTSCVEDPFSMESSPNNVLSNDEMSFISHYANENKRMSPEQAANIALTFNPVTRSTEVNVTGTDVLLKQDLESYGDSILSLLPDTLVYLINTDDGFCTAIPADNRVNTRILGHIPQSQIYDIKDETSWNIKDMTCHMFTNTVVSEICNYESRKDSVKATLLEKLNLSESTFTRARQDPYYTPDDYDFLTVYGNTTQHQVALCNPMTPWPWFQGSPYNRFVRHKQPCGIVPVGCVPLAMGLIMTYWGHPRTIDGHYMNWNLMRNDFSSEDSTLIGAVDIAYLMQRIGDSIVTNYQCDGSEASSANGISWLHNHGYQGGSQSYFNYDDVKNSLNNGKPVLISGDTEDSNSGHSWVIDGYKEIRHDTQMQIYAINKRTGQQTLIHEGVVHDYQYYLCNNFGNYDAESWISSMNYSCFQFEEYGSVYQYNLKIYTEISPY